jgi:hypothetical protein
VAAAIEQGLCHQDRMSVATPGRKQIDWSPNQQVNDSVDAELALCDV